MLPSHKTRVLWSRLFDTEENALKMAQEHNNYIYVPPYNDVHVIAGQVTVGLEILEQSSRQAAMIDVAFVCIGGGGLISGVAAYLKAKRPGVKFRDVNSRVPVLMFKG
ncbi:Threonine dehydratase biosynthetic [Seminavis robusta]|uniref:Threonine dehydratase biosynthetic n=1 Tax=Seminavis robusta TaxID=568900 RepID=A0A9N8HF93_9STRA|nr:Threonine dehydratase biosynthetic [Seminavis robusta]|eukprot:Sro424_g140030.1 Threonine dehydratase biosynthetic (108) ;mRNA; r:62466-62789